MTTIATSRPDSMSLAALMDGRSARGASSSGSIDPSRTGTSLIDRFLTPASSSSPANLTPVEQGEAARAADLADAARAAAAGAAVGGAIGAAVAGPMGAAAGAAVGGAIGAAAGAAAPHHPIVVNATVTQRADGTKLTTVNIDVAANFRIDGGTLPKGQTATTEARSIERSIERDFSKTYRDANGDETRYVTDVHITVNQRSDPGREQIVLVSASDARLGGGLGIAPGFEKGRVAYVSDHAGARTAPHEFGHLAGLRHTAQVDQGCTTAPGINIENLMSQTGCSPTSQQLERSQLEQIYNTPAFR